MVIVGKNTANQPNKTLICIPSIFQTVKGIIQSTWESYCPLKSQNSHLPEIKTGKNTLTPVLFSDHGAHIKSSCNLSSATFSIVFVCLFFPCRYYYKTGILERVDRRLVYKFGKNAHGWQENKIWTALCFQLSTKDTTAWIVQLQWTPEREVVLSLSPLCPSGQIHCSPLQETGYSNKKSTWILESTSPPCFLPSTVS